MVKEINSIPIRPYKAKTKEELRVMQNGIGGSDVGAIMGLSKRTPFQVFLDKTGEPEGFEANELMEVGWELEDYVKYRFCKKHNETFLGDKSLLNLYHPEIKDSLGRSIFRGSLDGVLVENGNELWVYEGKCTTGFYSLQDLLMNYFYQPLWYTYILDAHIKHHDLPYVVKGYKFGVFANLTVHRETYVYDEKCIEIINTLVPYLLSWWETHIVGKQRPDLVNEDYKQLLEFNGGECVNATEEAIKAVAAIKEINKQAENIALNFPLEGVNTAEKLIDTCKNIIKNCIGEGQFLYNGVQAIAELSAPTKRGSRTLKLISNE